MEKTHETSHSDELQKQKERFYLALKAAEICVFEVDLEKQEYTFFENAASIYEKDDQTILREIKAFSALPPEEYKKAVSFYFAHSDDHKTIDAAFEKIFLGESTTYCARMKAGDTRYVWCKVDVTPILKDGRPKRMIGVVSNIDHIMRQSEIYRAQAEHDPLTGLWTRQKTEQQIHSLLAQNKINRHALFLFDLDNFKAINDTRGHAFGDAVLQRAAKLLKDVFPKKAILSRWGGDEFLVFLPKMQDAQAVKNLLEPLFSPPDDRDFSFSAGVSFFPKDGKRLSALFERADTALYQAKTVKNTYRFSSNKENG